MTDHLDDLFAELALDADGRSFPLDGPVRQHLAACARCAREVAELTDTLAALSLPDTTTTSLPARAHRAGLLAATDPSVPHGPFLSRLARLFDLDHDQITRVVGDLADPARWEPTLLSAVKLFHFDGGPQYAKADNGFVVFGAGMVFPRHRHVGEETTLVLAGRIVVDDGAVLGPGDRMVMPDGAIHGFHIPDDDDCLCAVRLLGHIEPVLRRTHAHRAHHPRSKAFAAPAAEA